MDRGGLEDRLRSLAEADEIGQARTLARAHLSTTGDLEVAVREDRIVVDTPLFRGEHEVLDDDPPRIASTGEFRYRGDGPAFTVRVHSPNPAVAERATRLLGGERDGTTESPGRAEADGGEHPLRAAVRRLVERVFR
jgi:hypothetical protein